MLDLLNLGTFEIEWVESANQIDPAIWRELFPPHLEGLWWYQLLEQSDLQGQFDFFYALVKRDGKIVAIAPAFLMNVPIELVVPESLIGMIDMVAPLLPNLRYQRTFFIGSPCADEGTVGMRSGMSINAFLELLEDAVEKKAKKLGACMIVWKDFPDSYRASLSKLAEKKKMFAAHSYPGTVIECPADMDTYLQGLKGSRRHNLKKKLKKSKEAVALETTVIQHPDARTLHEVFSLFTQTYEKGKTKFEKLNIKFFQNAAVSPVAWFVLLREKASGQLVAFMLCFKLADRIINKFIGLDYSKPIEWSLYFRLWEASLDWVIETGCNDYQSGQTGYRFKLDVGNTLVPLTNYCKHTNPIVNALFSKLAKDITWSTLDDDLKTYLQAHPEDDRTSSVKPPTNTEELASKRGARHASESGRNAKPRASEVKYSSELEEAQF